MRRGVKCVKLSFADSFGPEYYAIDERLDDEHAIERARSLWETRVVQFPTPTPRTFTHGEVL